jgi:peptidoglycan hydrolase CwlO-like protein
MDNMKNMKVSIGLVIAIIVQAFGLIWYVAQLDSTVTNLDTSVGALQEQATTVDVAVLQKDLENIKDKITMMDEMHSMKFNPSELEEAIEDLEQLINELEKRQAIIENEMRTIMSDHGGFAEVLKHLNASGLLPSGEKRSYGDYD